MLYLAPTAPPDSELKQSKETLIITEYGSSILANMLGELTRKTVAKCFWEQELIEELKDLGLANTWVFCQEREKMQGTQVDAMEHVEKVRSEMLYSHECSDGCKEKGNIKLY